MEIRIRGRKKEARSSRGGTIARMRLQCLPRARTRIIALDSEKRKKLLSMCVRRLKNVGKTDRREEIASASSSDDARVRPPDRASSLSLSLSLSLSVASLRSPASPSREQRRTERRIGARENSFMHFVARRARGPQCVFIMREAYPRARTRTGSMMRTGSDI